MFEPISVGLSLVSFLVKPALRKLVDKAIERSIRPKDRKERALVVLEVGRPIVSDVEQQLGEVDIVIRKEGTVRKEELHRLAAEVYKGIAIVQRFAKEIILVLSGPIVLAFLIGQLVGLQHFNLKVAWWQKGEYLLIDDMSEHRELLF